MISASVVLYNTKIEFLEKLFYSFEKFCPEIFIIIVDNSPHDNLRKFIPKKYNYIHTPENIGYGHAHNLAIDLANDLNYKFHFIVNPDVYFNEDIITILMDIIVKDDNIGMIMPNILYPDGTTQYLPKLLPSPISIIIRKLKYFNAYFNKYINNYEFRNVKHDRLYQVPVISGCFSLIKIDAFLKVGKFDTNFFLYFEDWDLSRRISLKYKTLFYPNVSIIHNYASEANFKFKFFIIYCKSAILYFNKWGWILDRYRDYVNAKAINQLNEN